MSDTWVLIPAAGESKRYKAAGFVSPKPVLKISFHDKEWSMLKHVIGTVPLDVARVLVGLAADVPLPLDLAELRHPDVIERVDIFGTIGQADTLYQMVRRVPLEDQVLVLDCDMVLSSHDIFSIIKYLNVYHLVVGVTKTFDPNTSRVDEYPFPHQFVEKQPISEWGIVSARAFSEAGLLKSSLKIAIDKGIATYTEPYLSQAMNFYPGKRFAYPIEKYLDWGTPERLAQTGAHVVLD